MVHMNNLLRQSMVFVRRNAPTILTGLGGAGVIATAVMAVKATPKALQHLEAAEEQKGEKLTKLEAVKAAGVVYIPSIIMGATTITCIFGANILNTRQQAALMSAYALLDNSYKEYKTKVTELYGEDANEKVTDEIAKDTYNETDIQHEENKELFYEAFSGQYFYSTAAAVKDAEYQLNRDLVMRDYATLNEFYEYLDIPMIPSGDTLGWSSGMNFEYYWQLWVDFGHRKVTLDDGRECTVISMFCEPCVDWEDYG